MEEQPEMEPRRRRRSRWRTSVWLVLVGCVAFLSVILTMGFFSSADFILRVEAFAGFFAAGCVFLAVSRYSSNRKSRDADL
jgi:hypothetical protein